MLDVGASNFYSTIIIAALAGLNNKNNPDEFLQMTAAEASWFGMCSKIENYIDVKGVNTT